MNFVPAAAFAILGALLQLPVLLVQGFGPAPNLPIATLSFWFLYLNISICINFITWTSDDIDTWNSGAGWCDIDASMVNAANLGVLLGMLTVSINLYYLSKPTARRLTQKKMRIWKICDCLALFVIPTVFAIVRPFISTSRYGIVQNYGCSTAVPLTGVYVFFFFAIPIAIALVMTGLSVATIYQFVVRGKESVYQALRFKEKFSINFYFRTMAFVVTVLLICVPLIIVQNVATFTAQGGVLSPLPWAHGQPATWNVIEGALWQDIMNVPPVRKVYLTNIAYRFLLIALSYIGFICFGMGDTAIVCYRRWFVKLRLIGKMPSVEQDTELGSPVSWTSETKKNEISVYVGQYAATPT